MLNSYWIEHPAVSSSRLVQEGMSLLNCEARVRRWFRVWQMCGGGEVSSHHTTTWDSSLQQSAKTNIQCFVKKWILASSSVTWFSKSMGAMGRASRRVAGEGRGWTPRGSWTNQRWVSWLWPIRGQYLPGGGDGLGDPPELGGVLENGGRVSRQYDDGDGDDVTLSNKYICIASYCHWAPGPLAAHRT